MSSVRSKLAYAGVTFACALGGAAPAAASTTIGQVAPLNPPGTCGGASSDIVQPTVTSGASYVVPAGGVAITSWSTSATAGSGQTYTLKVFRLVSGNTYKIVGHDGPQMLTGSVLNTFSTNVPVQPGDVLGLGRGTVGTNCVFSAPGEAFLVANFMNGNDGDTETFTTSTGFRANISAVVGFKASNADTLGKVKLNKNNGTATLAVNVPGPGTLTLTGNGVKTQRPARNATASKTVSAPGKVKLLVKAKGKKKKKLNKTGKVKVKVSVVFTPSATGGDVAGDPKTQTKSVKLIKKH